MWYKITNTIRALFCFENSWVVAKFGLEKSDVRFRGSHVCCCNLYQPILLKPTPNTTLYVQEDLKKPKTCLHWLPYLRGDMFPSVVIHFRPYTSGLLFLLLLHWLSRHIAIYRVDPSRLPLQHVIQLLHSFCWYTNKYQLRLHHKTC